MTENGIEGELSPDGNEGIVTSRNEIQELICEIEESDYEQKTFLLKRLAEIAINCADADIMPILAELLAKSQDQTGSAGIRALKHVFEFSPASRAVIVQNVLKLENTQLVLHALKELAISEYAHHGECVEANMFFHGLQDENLAYYERNRDLLDKFMLDDVEMEKQDSSILPEPESRTDIQLRSGNYSEDFELKHYVANLPVLIVEELQNEKEAELTAAFRMISDEIFPFTQTKSQASQLRQDAKAFNAVATTCLAMLPALESQAARWACIEMLANMALFAFELLTEETYYSLVELCASLQGEPEACTMLVECLLFHRPLKALQSLPNNKVITNAVQNMIGVSLLLADIELERDTEGKLQNNQDEITKHYYGLLEEEYLVFLRPEIAPTCFIADFVNRILCFEDIDFLTKSNWLDDAENNFLLSIRDIEFKSSQAPDYTDCAKIAEMLEQLRTNERGVMEVFERLFPENEIRILDVLYACLKNGDLSFLEAIYKSRILRNLKDNIMLYEAKQRNQCTCIVVLQEIVEPGLLEGYQVQKELDILSKYFSNSWMLFAEVLISGKISQEAELALLSSFFSEFEQSTGIDVLPLLTEDRINNEAQVELLLIYTAQHIKTEYIAKYPLHRFSLYESSGKYVLETDIEDGLLVKVNLNEEEPFAAEYNKYSKLMQGFSSTSENFSFVELVLDQLSDLQEPLQRQVSDLAIKCEPRSNYFAQRRQNETLVEFLIQMYQQLHTHRERCALLDEFCALEAQEAETLKMDSNTVEFISKLLVSEKEGLLVEKSLDLSLLFLNNVAANKNQLGRAIIYELFAFLASSSKAIRFKAVECINCLFNLQELLSEQLTVRENVFADALLESLQCEQMAAATINWINQYMVPNVATPAIPANEFIKKLNKELQRLQTNSSCNTSVKQLELFINEHFISSRSCPSSPLPSRPATPIQMKSRAPTPIERVAKTQNSNNVRPPGRQRPISLRQSFFDRALGINVFQEQTSDTLESILLKTGVRLPLTDLPKSLQLIISTFDDLKYVADIALLCITPSQISQDIIVELLRLARLVRMSDLNQNEYLGKLLLISLFGTLSDEDFESEVLEAIDGIEQFADEQFIVYGLETFNSDVQVAMLYTLAKEMLASPELCKVLLLHMTECKIADASLKNCIINAARDNLDLHSREAVLSHFGPEKVEQVSNLLFAQIDIFNVYPDLEALDSEVSLVFNQLGSEIASEMELSTQSFHSNEICLETDTALEQHVIELASPNIYGNELSNGVRRLEEMAKDKHLTIPNVVISTAFPAVLDKIMAFNIIDEFETLEIIESLEIRFQFDGTTWFLGLTLRAHRDYDLVFTYIVAELVNCDTVGVLKALLDDAIREMMVENSSILAAAKILLIRMEERQTTYYEQSGSLDGILESLKWSGEQAGRLLGEKDGTALRLLRIYCEGFADLNSQDAKAAIGSLYLPISIWSL